MKLAFTILTIVISGFTFLIGYNLGTNDGSAITLKYDPACNR